MHRSAPRLTRILACAAVPVMLVVAGCSSDSDGEKDKASSSSPAPEATKSEAMVAAARFAELPDPCKSITASTAKSLVPAAKDKNGTPGRSSDTAARGSCSWNGLDDNGIKGSQYRWLDVGFTRFGSDQSLGSGADRAGDDLTKQIAKAKAAEGAKKLDAAPVSGIGETATRITYDLDKTGEDFKYATIVARTGNVVVTLTYNGAGYAGAKTPSADDIQKGAEKAAKEAVAAVATANESKKVGASPEPSGKASDNATKKATDKAAGKAAGKTIEKASLTSSAKPSAKSSAKDAK
ncbi:DUF3558 family protein [Streptomyces brevispora]|uniref:DUF3558 domain-containing protein n=1 Tax=Streptomyces brevispora TaxID=887462 RepID=A0A561UWZ9_9ACTN|nr:DUF3558 family protein [Streptomyces brevispora]TWG03893.1 uncharacterized protein DUF3558 [Streptomyces brevispora]WSC15075.1 DUF3558 domain-containing protein [Streptomyces brevispora]